tara:strand:+ start:1445 stop:1879 length:435 start_codon:yes stop_codon:yes gene_type:complete
MSKGIIKDCRVCGKQFSTNSMKVSADIYSCPDCWGKNKQSALTKNLTEKMNRAVMSIETRLDKVEEANRMIPMIVNAELSNSMLSLNGLSGVDIKELITTELAEVKKELVEHQLDSIKIFQKKLQKQVITLNNKIIKIMQEMKE